MISPVVNTVAVSTLMQMFNKLSLTDVNKVLGDYDVNGQFKNKNKL